MQAFELHRDVDASGVSGVGIVAEGIVFHDGSVAMKWRTHFPGLSIFASIAQVKSVHGHGGKTRVVWLDVEKKQA